jgi:hypothetical protein
MTDKEEIASLSQVFTVATQVRAPKGPGDPGAMVEGCYVVTDDVVTLTDRQGNPVRDQHGKAYTRKIANGDSPKTIAARLTKDFRLMLRGKDGRVNGFDRPIRYPKLVVV